ncbi:MAG: hypothetical protein KDC18_12400 [Alphaproteobacteria bacterium]|nr:hypothetical protein [Alphaproteobacteria bacterium]
MTENMNRIVKNSTKWLMLISACSTLFLLIIAAFLFYNVDSKQVADYGSFVGGFSTAIALVWIVSGFWNQRSELESLYEQLNLHAISLDNNKSIQIQSITIGVLPSYFEILDQIAHSLTMGLYPELLNTELVAIPDSTGANTKWINWLLSRSDVPQRIVESSNGGFPVSTVLVDSYIKNHQKIVDLLSPPNGDAEIWRIIKPVIDGHPGTNLRKILE